jgi:hypothetical protein
MSTLPSIIKFDKNSRNVLTNNTVFTKEELVYLFGEKSIVTWLKLNGYLYQSSDCRWRKTDKLDEILADGENIRTDI